MSVVVNHSFPHQHPSPNTPTPKHTHASHDCVGASCDGGERATGYHFILQL